MGALAVDYRRGCWAPSKAIGGKVTLASRLRWEEAKTGPERTLGLWGCGGSNTTGRKSDGRDSGLMEPPGPRAQGLAGALTQVLF